MCKGKTAKLTEEHRMHILARTHHTTLVSCDRVSASVIHTVHRRARARVPYVLNLHRQIPRCRCAVFTLFDFNLLL